MVIDRLAAALAVVGIGLAACDGTEPSPPTVPPTMPSGTWAAKSGWPTQRSGPAVATVNGVIYVVGGVRGFSPGSSGSATVEAYAPATDTWTAKASMPDGRKGALSAVVNGALFILGGAKDFPFAAMRTVWSYDPAANAWTTRAPMPTARIGYPPGTPSTDVSVIVANGIVYVLGGDSPSVDAYDPTTDAWTSRAPQPASRIGMSFAVINGIIYAFGGNSTAVHAFDPATNAWTSRAPLLTPRSSIPVAVVNDRIYAISGRIGNVWNTTVEVYDPASNTWARLNDLPKQDASPFRVSVLDGIIHVVTEGISAFHALDPGTGIWFARAPVPVDASGLYPVGVEAIGGRLYVVNLDLQLQISRPVLVFTP